MLHRLSERFEMIVRSASEIRFGNDQEMIFTRKEDSPDGMCWSVRYGDIHGDGKYDDRDLAETIEDMTRDLIGHTPRIMIGEQEFFKVYRHMFGDLILCGYGSEVWRYGEPICDLWEEFYWFSARPNYKVWSVLSFGGTEMRFENTYNIPTEPIELMGDVLREYAFVVDGDRKWLVDKPTLMWFITYANSIGGTITAETGDGNIIPCKPPKNVKELYGKDPSKHFDRLSNTITKRLKGSYSVIVEYNIAHDGPQRVYFNRDMGSGKDMWRLHERYNEDDVADAICSLHRVVDTIARAMADNWKETECILVDGVSIDDLLNEDEDESTEDVVRYLVDHTPHIELINKENDEPVRYIISRRSPTGKWLMRQTDPPIHITSIWEIDDLVDQIMSRLNDERYIYSIFGVSIQERIRQYRDKRKGSHA